MPYVTRLSTQGNVYRQATEPTGWLNGDLWIDTDDGSVYVNISGTATLVAPVTASSTTTFTNKTIDEDATGNSITNLANANIKAAAAIAYSKLNLTTSILNADISTSANIAASKIAQGIYRQIGTVILGAEADTISLTGLTARKFLIARLSIVIATPVTVELTFNNNTDVVYSHRRSLNGAADTTATSDSKIILATAISGTAWEIWIYIPNTATARKWGYWIAVSNGAATDATTAPDLIVGAFKFNSATAITRIDATNTDTGGYAANTELTVWGTDLE